MIFIGLLIAFIAVMLFAAALGRAAKIGDWQLDHAIDRVLAGPQDDEPCAEIIRFPAERRLHVVERGDVA